MDLPVVDLAPFLGTAAAGGAAEVGEDVRALCATVSASLRDTGALLVKDPRCSAADNDRFLDVVERYFSRSAEAKRLQERPHLHYQVAPTDSAFGLVWIGGEGLGNRKVLNSKFTPLPLARRIIDACGELRPPV
jgi:hypothetical protein